MELQEIMNVKVAAAVSVAACIYFDVEKLKNDKHKLKRLRIAADALDRTMPLPAFAQLYQGKPATEPDALFLLKHLSYLCLQTPTAWPSYKVKSHEWGEYTRVVKGLDAFLRADLNTFSFDKETRLNVKALLTFITKAHVYLPDDTANTLKALDQAL